MSETNARREARRRRILENSESRLRRITGRIDPDEKTDNPRVETETFYRNLKAESNFEKDNVRNGICNINSNVELQDSTRSNDKYQDFLNNTNDKNTYLPNQVSKSKFILCTLFNRITFILLAGIVNILLVLKLDNLFGHAILIPFFLLMLGRLYSCTMLHEVQDGSLLVTALILCNVKPRLIYICKVSFALFTMILNDFGLYMFSFVLIRYVIIHYYYYDAAVPINA
ncbi:hypothetical protein P5V15_004499 [Pogonomyrmex californicus]